MMSTKNMMTASNGDISEQLAQQVGDLAIMNNDLHTSFMVTTCANCGKEGSNLNICNKCKTTTYCNAACKKKHRSKHKKDCEMRVAELQEEELERERREAELHDEALFKQPPPAEDCPICMLPLPSLHTGLKYRSCCGKIICSGCIHAVAIRDGGVCLCPFCRTPTPTTEEMIEQNKKRMKLDDAGAIYEMGCCYADGICLPQDRVKALELWYRAAELGNTASHYNIGIAYLNGNGVERDEKKAIHYWELAAIGGHAMARHNLGVFEKRTGNMNRALKHFMISVGFGCTQSLENLKHMFMNGDATKEDYAKALRAHQAFLDEIKSPQRDEAATFGVGSVIKLQLHSNLKAKIDQRRKSNKNKNKRNSSDSNNVVPLGKSSSVS
jgi:TPR repeat protein